MAQLKKVVRALASALTRRRSEEYRSDEGKDPSDRQHDDADPATAPEAGQTEHRQAGLMVGGTLQIVTLSDLGQGAQVLSSELHSDLRAIADQEIQRALHPPAFLRVLDDHSFLIFFPDTTLDAARAASAQISRSIRDRIDAEVPQAADRIGIDRFIVELEARSRDPSPKLLAQLRALRREAEEISRLAEKTLFRDVRILFQPLWSASRGGATINRCLLDPFGDAMALARQRSQGSESELGDAVGRIDGLLLTRAAKALHGIPSHQRNRVRVMLPVHVSTLASPERAAAYLRLLETLPGAYRKLLIPELRGVTPSLTQPTLRRLMSEVAALHPQGIVLQMSPRDPRLAGLTGALSGLSLTLAGRKLCPRTAQVLRQFADEAANRELETILFGADNLGLLKAARTAGFDHVGGTAAYPAMENPKAGI